LDSGAGVQIRRTVALNIPPPLTIASVAKRDGNPASRLRLKLAYRRRRGSNRNRLLGYWRLEARLYHLRVNVRAQDQGNGGWPMEPLIRER